MVLTYHPRRRSKQGLQLPQSALPHALLSFPEQLCMCALPGTEPPASHSRQMLYFVFKLFKILSFSGQQGSSEGPVQAVATKLDNLSSADPPTPIVGGS